MDLLIKLILLVGLSSGPSRGDSIFRIQKDGDENEVLKKRPLPKVPADVYEAYYYQSYGDVTSNAIAHVQGGREGSATLSDSCEVVGELPELLRNMKYMKPKGISRFYQKYTEAYGIPVIANELVSDRALIRACYVLRFLLADREDLRQAFYKAYGRVAIIGGSDVVGDIPEYHFLPEAYNEATRGLGAIPVAPVSTAGEENILCQEEDPHDKEDILLREIAVGIYQIAAKTVDNLFEHDLVHQYERAMASKWWGNTYAERSPEAYFGEGVQSFFNANAYARPPDGYHNEVNSRVKLRMYDPHLYMLIQRIFPCANNYMKRCNNRGNEFYQRLHMDCPAYIWGRKKRSILDLFR